MMILPAAGYFFEFYYFSSKFTYPGPPYFFCDPPIFTRFANQQLNKLLPNKLQDNVKQESVQQQIV